MAEAALDVAFARRWMAELAAAMEDGCDTLTRLDAAIGDADHGINMLRGMNAATMAIESNGHFREPSEVFESVGSRLVSVVGGAAGPLYGSAFRSIAKATAGREVLTLADLVAGLAAGLAGIQKVGAAEPGDKTIVDAWGPAVQAINGGHSSLRSALAAADFAARRGMVDTIPMRARKGRASYLGWRSEGHQDPGATSASMIFSSLATSVSD